MESSGIRANHGILLAAHPELGAIDFVFALQKLFNPVIPLVRLRGMELSVKGKISIIGLTIGLALTGCTGAEGSEASPSSFDTTGSVAAPSGADSRYEGHPCDMFRGVTDRPVSGNFDDIREGVQVVVKDESGKTIALSALEAGTLIKSNTGTELACRYGFTLTDIPDNEFYGVQIGGSTRGDVQFTRAEMKAGPALMLR